MGIVTGFIVFIRAMQVGSTIPYSQDTGTLVPYLASLSTGKLRASVCR
jgi:hypothetical protein